MQIARKLIRPVTGLRMQFSCQGARLWFGIATRASKSFKGFLVSKSRECLAARTCAPPAALPKASQRCVPFQMIQKSAFRMQSISCLGSCATRSSCESQERNGCKCCKLRATSARLPSRRRDCIIKGDFRAFFDDASRKCKSLIDR